MGDRILDIGYQELCHWYPQWKLGEAIPDSANDSLPIYTMLEHDDVCAIIDLNLRRSGKLVYNDFTIGKDGEPIAQFPPLDHPSYAHCDVPAC